MSEAQGFRWSAEMVAADLVEAFRVLPTMPVYSPRKSEHYPALRGQDGTSLDLVAVSERVLGRRSPERLALLVWARSKATRGDVGGSVRAYCVEAGTNVQTFNRQRKRACARIAADLNRLPAGQIDACGGRTGRFTARNVAGQQHQGFAQGHT